MTRRAFFEVTVAGLVLGGLDELSGGEKPRILVAYATRCGSTVEIAQGLVEKLKGRGYMVDLSEAKQVKALGVYGGVVLGSAVRFGKWLPEAVDFVGRNQAYLKRIPTAFFTVHMLNTGADEASRKARLVYVAPARAMVEPGIETFFAGKMDMGRLTLGERLLCKMMKGGNEDKRDWAAIHAWGKKVFA